MVGDLSSNLAELSRLHEPQRHTKFAVAFLPPDTSRSSYNIMSVRNEINAYDQCKITYLTVDADELRVNLVAAITFHLNKGCKRRVIDESDNIEALGLPGRNTRRCHPMLERDQ